MIRFYTEDCRFILKEKTKIKDWISRIAKSENKLLKNLNIIFVSDQYELNLNKTFLKHDYFTDIITFNYAAQPEIIEGEMYISADRVKENAQKFKVSNFNESQRVIVHGLLHLCGYDDRTPEEEAAMHRLEDYYLSLY